MEGSCIREEVREEQESVCISKWVFINSVVYIENICSDKRFIWDSSLHVRHLRLSRERERERDRGFFGERNGGFYREKLRCFRDRKVWCWGRDTGCLDNAGFVHFIGGNSPIWVRVRW